MARRLLRRAAGGLLAAVAVLGLAVGVTALVVRALGADPAQALGAIHAGSIASPASLTESLIKATPLVFTGLSVAVAFRCGIWNIGAEGQLLMGMLGGALAALYLPPLPPAAAVPLCLAAGALSGALWAGLAAFLKERRGVPEVISTIMLNFLAVYLIEYLVRGPIRDPKSAADWSPLLPERSYLPRLDDLFGVRTLGGGTLRLPNGWPAAALGIEAARLHAGALLALLAAALVWLWLERNRAGFRIRAVGLNPSAARAAGIPVPQTTALAFLASGALAGLGGAVEILGLVQRMYRYDPGSPGYGYTGIAVALLGGLDPMGALAAALFFGALAAGSNQMQRSAGVSFHVAYVVQAALVLLLVTVPHARSLVSSLLRSLRRRGS